MVSPAVGPGIKERDKFVGLRIVTCNVARFETIAVRAGPTSIVQRIDATVLSSSDVIDFVREYRIALRKFTILATIACPIAN
jgi:hypothetical protein